MTREEFVAAYRHEIDGWILDAAMEGRHGAQLSVWLRQMRQKIEAKLGSMYDAATMKPAMPNGQPIDIKVATK